MTHVDLSRAVWHKCSRSGLNGGTEDCVEIAALEGGRIAVRDSKNPGGAVLVLTRAELAAWISGVKNNEFVAPA